MTHESWVRSRDLGKEWNRFQVRHFLWNMIRKHINVRVHQCISSEYYNQMKMDYQDNDSKLWGQSYLCLDESSLIDRWKHRTLTLSVNGDPATYDRSPRTRQATLLSYLFKIFPRAAHLKFYPDSTEAPAFVDFTGAPSMFSSTLVELHIDPYRFKDLLYLLDGRFDHLRKLVVKLLNLWRMEPFWSDIVVVTVGQSHQAMSIDRPLPLSL